MKSGILTIMKKELTRFFTDKRLVFTTILMPGVLIYLMYTFMGSAITSMYSPSEETAEVAVVNLPDSIASVPTGDSMKFVSVDASELESLKKAIENAEKDILVVFPSDFDEQVAAYRTDSGAAAPNVEIYFNSSTTDSQNAYRMMAALLDGYESSLANKFDINAGDGIYDLATVEDTASSFFASMLPLLLMIFLFSGCMAVAPESIAGEKERGTITTILITPIRRGELAIGKIAALAIVALLSGISSALGTILSLPKLIGGAGLVDASIYGMKEYLMLLVLILSTVLLIITAISIISAFAKTVKEAQGYVTPMMILVMAVGITAMFGAAAPENPLLYLIPFYNTVQCMAAVFSFEAVTANLLICLIANAVYTALGVFALAKMFNSEKIIFSK